MVLNLSRSSSKSGWSSKVGHTQSTWSVILNWSYDLASMSTPVIKSVDFLNVHNVIKES